MIDEQGKQTEGEQDHIETVEEEPRPDVQEKVRRYEVTGAGIVFQGSIGGVVAECPGCQAKINTLKDETNKDHKRITWQPQAFAAFMGGGQINVACPGCGVMINIRKPLVQTINQGPNRNMRRGMAKQAAAKKGIKVVSS